MPLPRFEVLRFSDLLRKRVPSSYDRVRTDGDFGVRTSWRKSCAELARMPRSGND